MSVMDKIVEYLRNNVTKSVKELMATVGSMLLTLFATILFIMRSGFGMQDALIIILLELQPFCYIYIKIIFSGQTNLKDQEILLLKNQLENLQELTEYKIRLAARDAIVSENKNWNDINQKILELEKTLNL